MLNDWSRSMAENAKQKAADDSLQFLIDENVKLRGEIQRLRIALRNIVDCDELTSELYTNHKDRADNFADKARAALMAAAP